jgi:hypothetical protein
MGEDVKKGIIIAISHGRLYKVQQYYTKAYEY